MKIAKSLALGNVTVFLASFSNIFSGTLECVKVDENIFDLRTTDHRGSNSFHMIKFLRSVNKFIKTRKGDKVIYLYPTTYIIKDFIYLFYFKFIKRYRFFCEINELRTAKLSIPAPHPGFAKTIRKKLKYIRDYFLFNLNERQVPFYDGIVVISTSLEKYFSGFSNNIIRVPILCDASVTIKKLSPPDYNGETFKLCFAGYIHCKKEGFDIFLEALSLANKKKNVELFMYGPLFEHDRKELFEISERLGIKDKVHYIGNIDPEKLPDEFLKYHLLILPRHLTLQTQYGFSTKLSEYLTSGVPALVTDVSDNSLFIRDNYNGFIIPPGSVNIMVEKLLEIIDNYNAVASRLAVNAIETAKKELDFRIFTGTFIDFFFKTN
jgi:glycosyltransferase involved in cell wall biosynthesis